VSPAHVLSVYAEPLVTGRRVALLAPEDSSLTEALLALGARLLYVYDPREGAASPHRGADPRVTIAPLRAGDLGVREGAFDVAIVPDLTLLGDAESALAYVRRLVGNNGVALIASRNRDANEPWARAPEGGPAPSYTDLYDLCALQFAEVRMAGVAPFAAYAIAEFAPDREPSIAFDASLVTAPEPAEWFLAIASQSEVTTLEAYEIIQIPRDVLALEVAADSEPTTDPGELDALRQQIRALDHKRQEAEARAGEEVLRAERLNNELRTHTDEVRKLKEKSTRAQKELEDERRAKQRLESELRSPEIAQLRERVLALEAELIEARTQLATPRVAPADPRIQNERDALAHEAGTLRSALQQAKGTIDDLRRSLVERDRELDATLVRAKSLEDRLAEHLANHDENAQLVAHVRAGETVAARLREELAGLQSTHEQDVASLESALRTAGEQLRAANIELIRRERMIRDLVSQIEESGDQVAPELTVKEPPPELIKELDLARRELSTLVDEVRRRDRAVEETRTALEAARREVETERAKMEQLARDAARREAALQTASWKIAELESLRADAPNGKGDDSELDALRRALEQEHARVEALERQLASATEGGSGELRARLQEQEALIKQLSAELAQRQG